HYSSGMYMRLAFAVAVHTHPQILIVDEILAVGDTAFQAKCFARMEEFKKSKEVTIVFVSHNLEQIKKFCTKVISINHSKITSIGETKKIIKTYIKISKINKKTT
ncbi:MAG: ABC transporter ATP-binding protein, partial [Candidatus Shapirobacteria bacterium]|nr:ABC transporter ATP-binding protein [Candidatus Shapirobacteria bacterium]